MAQGFEIERKFLVGELPAGYGDAPSSRIEQGYLAISADGLEVRVRRKGERTLLTIKSGPAQVRVEEELEIDARRFASLWPLTAGRRVVKTRYELDGGDGAVIELDVFEDALAGLRVAEVEFDSEAASAAFTPPAWFGREVTGERAYANQRLATDGPPDER
jgi:CYTH domain-containing protein